MSTALVPSDYILGIDLGSNSIGWAMIGLSQGKPVGLTRAGVRVFDAGMEGDLESGREESRNVARRDARMQRRQMARRARRLTKIFHILQRIGLLPPADLKTPEQRQEFVNQLDSNIIASDWFKTKRAANNIGEIDQVMPYLLRAAALDEPLEPYYLGRALSHLGQRRGFLSNRKKPMKKGEDEGVVKESIADLRQKIQESGARTLGEYFLHLNPFERRIRQRWTHRDMYEGEFEKIWEAQAAHHPVLLTPERKKELKRAIFYQRPLRFPRELVGHCELEPEEIRAPRHYFIAQRFRLLQSLNNLRVAMPGEPERDLTQEERTILDSELELQGDRTFGQIRKLLGLKRATFNLESGGEKLLRGNRTTAQFCKVFGERWLEMSAVEHEQALQDVRSIVKDETRLSRGSKHWKLDPEHSRQFAAISLEPDYFNLSRKAMERLLPLLETGVSYATARRQLYPERFQAREPVPLLPPVHDAFEYVRNPAVERSLTELRKVVNALVRQYGKPAQIRVELARDLRKSRKEREANWKKNRDIEKSRKDMAERITAEAGLTNPSREDIRKALLAKECGWVCPYTGRAISMRALVGPDAQFDIEHIIPFSQSLDNSFFNVTLCYHEENRNRKRNQTPYGAYGNEPEKYQEILDRVRRFDSDLADEKLKRFQLKDTADILQGFVDRQLNDTRYASTMAGDYLGFLYGGKIDCQKNLRVRATTGQVTAYLRDEWMLNRILRDGPTEQGGKVAKSREDHRHHAVDAIAIALTDESTIQQLSRAAQQAPQLGRRRFAPVQAPWPDFVDSVRAEIGRVVVSHRPSRKVSGALHEETLYSKSMPVPDSQKSQEKAARVRKPLERLSKSEVEDIADLTVREMVQKRLAELGGDPKKFSIAANLPFFKTADGREIPIKSARVIKKTPTFSLGMGCRMRNVTSESNHHLEIFAELDEHGEEVEWEGVVVPLAEAYKRLLAEIPIVQRDFGVRRQFKFSLAAGDVIQCDDEHGGRRLLVVRGTSIEGGKTGRVALVPINDARKKNEIVASKDYFRFPLEKLRKLHTCKVSLSPLGDLGTAND
jgi:CRISPR-associated endonuclease Csn1